MRATEAAIKKIVPFDDDDDLSPFMEIAADMVDELLTPLGKLSEGRLTIIENWLSAHFYALLNSRASSEQADVVQTSFATQNKVDLGFDLTVYGQTAKRLDTTLTLAALDNVADSVKKLPSGGTMNWLGTSERGCAYE